MQIPEVPLSGQNWKSAVLQWIRSAVSYMKTTRIIPDNKTVFGTYTSDGLILSCSPGSCRDGSVSYPPYEYRGNMKIIRNSDGNIEVIKGGEPDADHCGLTDLTDSQTHGWLKIPRKVFTPEEIGERAVIHLGAYWNEKTGYEVTLFLEGKMPEQMSSAERYVSAVQVGSVRKVTYKDGSIEYWIYQDYRDNSAFFYFGRSYLI